MTIFTKLYQKNSENALKDILEIYNQKGFAVVNYLYFANLVSNGILSGKNVNKEYLKSLENGDFLLPDGIALKLYAKKYFKVDLENLNGTDFSDYLLENLNPKDFNLILYGAKSEVIKKAVESIEEKYGLKVAYFQDGYSEFDFEKLNNKNSFSKQKINIFFVGLGTPKQEIWIKNNIEFIKKYNLLTFSQGGTFDFWAGEEKRAPKIFLILKLEWLWRFATNPKKNFKKVWYSFYLFYYLYSERKFEKNK